MCYEGGDEPSALGVDKKHLAQFKNNAFREGIEKEVSPINGKRCYRKTKDTRKAVR